MELLLNNGADVNSRGDYNSTPLHEAAESGSLDIARLLLSRGADVDVLDLDDWGESPF